MSQIEIIYEGKDIATAFMGQLFGYQQSLMEDWHTALDVFEKILSAPSSKEITPNFDKVFWGFIKDKVMGGVTNIIKHLPGGDFSLSVIELNRKFDQERERAAKQKTEKALADFYVNFRTWIGDLKAELVKNIQKEQDRVEKEYIQFVDQEEKHRYLKKLYAQKKDLEKERNAIDRKGMTIQISSKWIEAQGGNLDITMNTIWEIKVASIRCPKGAQISDIMRTIDANPFDIQVNKMVTSEAITWTHDLYGPLWWSHEHNRIAWVYPSNGYYSDSPEVFAELAKRKFAFGTPLKWTGS